MPRNFPVTKKNKLEHKPVSRLPETDRETAFFMYALFCSLLALEIEGSNKTDKELKRVEGNKSKGSVMPVKMP